MDEVVGEEGIMVGLMRMRNDPFLDLELSNDPR